MKLALELDLKIFDKVSDMREQESKRPFIGVGTLNISPRAKELVNQVLDSNRLSYGPMTQTFESRFASLHNCPFGLMSNSGTSALQVALGAMKELHGWRDGDEVIVPAITFVATANIVLHNRMQPVFVDVDPLYYGINPEKIEASITPRTRAIIPVHLFGQPCDMDPIIDIARSHNLRLIEDSCETMFAKYKGRSVGGLGDIGCFSTYVAHLLTTGVGGINTTNSPEYAVKIRSLINHGRDSIYLNIDDDNNKPPDELRMIIARRFSFVSLGHSFRLTELEAALGIAQIEEREKMLESRRQNAAFLIQTLSDYEASIQLPRIRPECDHSFMMFPVVLRDQNKEEFTNFLEQHGVETRDMLPITNQPVYKHLMDIRENDYPVAKWINQNGFYIGCHHDLKASDLDYIVELFGRNWRRRKEYVTSGSTLVLVVHHHFSFLEDVLEEIPYEFFDQVLAVDLGADDRTLACLKGRDVRIIPAEYQDVISTIYSTNIEMLQENIVFFPLDGRQDAKDIVRLLLALERGSDMVIASRFVQGGARHDRDRRFRYRSTGNRALTLLANLIFYGNFTDTLSKFRGIKRSWLKELDLDTTGFGAMYQMSIRAMQRGLRVFEIPTAEQTSLTHREMRKAWGSLIPTLTVLFKEWLTNREEGR